MPLLQIIILFILFNFISNIILDCLNISMHSKHVPDELLEICDAEQLAKIQEYERTKTRFGIIATSFNTMLLLTMLLLNGFAMLDNFLRTFTDNPMVLGPLFFGILIFASDILNMPFSIYNTFVIEEKFGFNKTTARTFISDKLKSWLLTGLIGGGLLFCIIWLFTLFKDHFWIYAWILISCFSVFMAMFYTTLILPLFNKLTPLAPGSLRQDIEKYLLKSGLKLEDIYVIDGSRRSSKSNAFFSGLGPKKKIILYDTLIEQHSNEELVSILAHEVGHYKKKHIIANTLLSIMQTGILLYVFSFLAMHPALASAMGSEHPSFHLSLLAFSMLYSPISLLLGIVMNSISRKNELEADQFAKSTFDGKALQSALKKLSLKNLSNLLPHPVYVFVHYSHPPLIRRLKALNDNHTEYKS